MNPSSLRAGMSLLLLATSCLTGIAAEPILSKDAVNNASFTPAAPSVAPVNATVLRAEVLLDRALASPGVLDGKRGENFRKAISVFAERNGIPATTDLNQSIWQALTKDSEPVLVDYPITEKDIAGPFIGKVPADYGDMSKLPALGYKDAVQALAARFHMDEPLLKQLNPKADFEKVGTTIVVASVRRDPIQGKIARIDVDKVHDQVRVLDKDGKLLVAYPATIGSDRTPAPTGTYKVRAIAKNPNYTYDPDKNFKQGSNDRKLTIKPGPNNPVGTVFIALTKPTFGIHGTPEPAKIDKVGSHGCVRLTNWDVEQLAQSVKPGVEVHFID